MGLFDGWGNMGGMEDVATNTPTDSAGLMGGLSGLMRNPQFMAGLAGFGKALAQAGAPRRGPLTWGGALSDAFSGMQTGQEGFDDKKLKKMMQDLQMQHAKLQNQKEQGNMDFMSKAFPSQGASQPAPVGLPPMGEMGAAPQASAPQSSFSGLPLSVIAEGAMRGIPGMKEQLDIAKYINEGSKKEQGATYVNPVTRKETYYPKVPDLMRPNAAGGVELLPGAAESSSRLKESETLATEGAKANFDIVQVPDGRGGMISMPRAQAVVALGGANPNKIPSPFMGGLGRGLSKAEEAKMTGDVGNQVGSVDLGNKNFLDKDYTPVIEQGKTATITINQAQIARKALEGMGGTNWAKPAITTGAKILNVLGIPNAEKVAANAELFQSTLYTHVLNKQLDQKGPQTESDAKRMSMTYAQLSNTTKANEFLLASIEAQARIEKMREEFYRKALPIAQRDGDLAAVGREWANRQPSLFDMPSMTKFK